MKKLLSIAIGSIVLLSGCTHRITDFTYGSTKNYNLNSNKFIKGKRVTGEHTVVQVIFPLGRPDIKTAIDKAIEPNKCAVALSDIVVSSVERRFIVGTFGYIVEGTEVLDRNLPGCENVEG